MDTHLKVAVSEAGGLFKVKFVLAACFFFFYIQVKIKKNKKSESETKKEA